MGFVVYFLVETIEALLAERGEEEKMWASMVKQTMKGANPTSTSRIMVTALSATCWKTRRRTNCPRSPVPRRGLHCAVTGAR